MFIYTVKYGDSLFRISSKYQVSMESIRNVNGLTDSTIVPGEALIVPASYYIVQPGDSLYAISQISFIPIPSLRSANRLQSDVLTVGMRLVLPSRIKYPSEGLSYLLPATPEQTEETARNFSTYNTYYGIFEYHITEGGNLSTLDNDESAIRASRKYHVAPLATITNLTPAGFSPELTRQVLNSPTLRNELINNIYTLVKDKNFAGVNIDFERVSEDERDLYTGFLKQLSERLKPEDYYISVALPVKRTENEYRGYDYGGIGSVVDFVFIMAYDFHEAHSDPGPVAPIDEIRKTLDYAIQKMSSHKIIVGVPRYGYDWTIANGSVISGKAVSVATATETASKYEVPILYSIQYQQPYFSYWDLDGRRHIVWFEDARARAAKFQLFIDYKLRGVGAWQLGLNFPQSVFLVSHFFTVKKVL
ncbi:glycosyl hydrolase family 18 protein [Paenibacillus filicis]|uniref:Glycosyl hydrolase family 18 protein n=1 Tax=Paenibacillus gyeongsangnamensis TaxID=3388067 RepID=A0ABT4QEB3_9BACL|nr:glycosyl hydrolase family 18 protein [Paenibacillus filicis]MCZ8515191.1 glycosyl hydrolase family 18 protein [Paenibacillus filicis]